MSRKAIGDGQRAQLLAAFREQPGGERASYVGAAERASCDWRTARRAWETGWPGVRPLKEHVAEERILARAELSKSALTAKAAAAPALATEDASLALAREVLLARVGRELALSFLGDLAPLRGYVKALAARVNRPEAVAEMSTEEALGAMRDAASTMSRVFEVAQKAIQVERLALGAPTEMLGVVPVSEGSVTIEVAAAEMAAAQRALARITKLRPQENADGPGDSLHA
jgi:hypothetical protein